MKFLKKLLGFKMKESQAELITAWIDQEDDDGYGWVAIVNKSNIPVYKVILSVVNIQNDPSSGKDTPNFLRAYLDLVPPGKYYTRIQVHHGMSFISGLEIAFIDSFGQFWVRNGNSQLSKINMPPNEYYNIGLPLSWVHPIPEIPQT